MKSLCLYHPLDFFLYTVFLILSFCFLFIFEYIFSLFAVYLSDIDILKQAK